MDKQRLDAFFLLILFILDLILLSLALTIAYNIRFNLLSKIRYFYVEPNEVPEFFPYYLGISIILTVLWIILLILNRVYSVKNIFSYYPVVNAITVGIFLVSSLSFFYREFSYSRLVFILAWGVALFLTFISRVILYIVRAVVLGRRLSRALIIGNNEFAKSIISSGKIRDYAEIEKDKIDFGELESFVDQRNIQEIIVTGEISDDELLKLISLKRKRSISIKIVPEGYLIFAKRISFDEISGIPILEIEISPLEGFQGYIKEIIDFLLGTLALILFSPLFLIIALLIKLDSPGPIFYKHLRAGRYGKPFYLWKFRTMYKDADKILDKYPELKREFEKEFKLKNDPRVTKVGKFLRKFSLDEIPQIFNILKGEMSVVGPRPVTFKELEKYGEYAEEILRVKPGLTGLWQVSGRSDVDYSQRIKFDLYYIQNWSILLDIKIILKTIPSVLLGKGAY
ncbi:MULTISPECIES: sugar transferase [Dictyoglomus]|jgi:exopolysaccharide biosynthesis polyprenyl glycosylphosphotransferase|uniref:Exopolysaccharide biosynthesis polyprenyl glycosylphosphotransferase n=1 Tax=Dictyoglomus turgidum (strain DSM 6724 / Z-1310) TaxID=515635 RepID=B8E143_DICTD|nr:MULTISPECIES: sugar transferase [Dictyoglomus]ACK42171.1 exopolysaccharide biosynthesis polyprenyl glycosylphosphotransferase [Dictyoglomus turgidum DSM 6724]PNV78987.1 MAG: sugar transferase [Dictyoglomus turgidum]HBU32401.1 sugar transferase [Dictyoglomus sp.]